VAEQKPKSQIAGDFLREMAVLIVVFYPLDAGFTHQFDWSVCSLVVVFAVILLWLGMVLEGTDDL
jgi:hypothetical protein